MKLSANLIFDNLPAELDAAYHGQRESTLHLLRPEFLEKGQERFRADHVYLVKAQDLPLRPRIEPGALILLLGDSVYLPRYEGKCSVIQLRGDVRSSHAFNLISRIYNRFDRWEESLRRILDTTASLSEMIQRSREVFDNPIVVLNSNFHYLAHTDFSFVELGKMDRISWGSRDSTGLPLESLNEFMELHEMSTDVREPLLLNLPGSTTLNVNLFENGEYSGCLSIDYRNRKYRESDKQLAIYLAEMIQLALRRYSSVSGSDQSRLRQALMDIVDGVQVTLNQRRTIDTSYLEQEHICVKIKFRSPLVQLPVKYLCNAIEDEFRRSVAFEYDEALICFIEISRQQAEEESYLALLQKHLTPLLRAFDSSVGISDPFHDIYQARPYYYQACAAVENGQLFHSDKMFYPFRDYALRELLINAIGNLPMEMYYTQGLQNLMRHDLDSQVSYMETLRIYLDCNMSVTKTTAKLYLNRSTLIERLARIKRELNCDLEDPEQRLLLQILLKAQQIHGEIGQKA